MSINRGMNKEDVVHIYNGILLHYNWVIFLILQAIKKDEIMPFAATWMDLETVILSAVSQRRNTVWRPLYDTECSQSGEKHCMTSFIWYWVQSVRGETLYDVLYMCHLKRSETNELIHKTDTDPQTQKRKLWLPGGEDGRKGQGGSLDWRAHTVIFKMDNHKALLYRTGNTARCHVAAWMGGEIGGEWIHVYAEVLCCAAETITALLTNYPPI